MKDSLKPGFQKGKLRSEQTRGVVTFFLKTNKGFTSLNNYRLITNVDYKIGGKAIASRLKLVFFNKNLEEKISDLIYIF